MNKLDMTSNNTINSNITKIEEIFPNCIIDGKIDFDMLKQELSDYVLDNKKEKYQLTWPGKNESLIALNNATTNTLRPMVEKSKNFYNTQNIYIEGDNLEVLKILQESYLNKIKCIYIDPPYNTGNDFIYNDDFKKSENDELLEEGQIDEYGNRLITNNSSNGRFHSDWLSMMYPRLKLARNLLTDDGIIFISIDDNELYNLKKICDEIFGENNFVANIVLENDSRARPYNSIATTHEYILVYVKSNSANINVLSNPDKKFSYTDDIGGFDLYELRNRNVAFNINNRPNLYYPFYVNENNCDSNGLYEISLDKIDGWTEVYPQESNSIKTVWRWGKEKASQNLNTVLFGKRNTSGGWQIVKKYRENTYVLNSVWTDKEFKSDRGTLEVKKIFDNKKYFDFPKPVALIKRFIELFTNDGDIILDFFSGSGTTAHAVMESNNELDRNVRYILVQLPEPTSSQSEAYKDGYETICDIGEERIRRVSNTFDNSLTNNHDNGFKIFKLDTSNMKDVFYKPSDVEQMNLLDYLSNVKEDRTPEDLLTQVMLDLGLTLDLKIEEKTILSNKVFYVEDNSLVACFDDQVDINIIDEICKCNPMKVVFKDISFKTDKDKINLEERIKKLSPETEINIL
jgi:adenine-specific DNA-methyltransferase